MIWFLLNFTFVNGFLQVNNTDAEGRLTLADALVYAGNQGVENVIKSFILKFYVHVVGSVFVMYPHSSS
jgi:hypothetical protein